MKRNLLPVLSSILCILLIFLLGRPIGKVPALGPLLSPSHGYLQNREPQSDLSDQSIPLDLHDANSQVLIDSLLIPHIYCYQEIDAYKIQGFLEAKYRLWQMDFITRVAAGRISEVVGSPGLEYDKTQRRKGLAVAAERTATKWGEYPESYSYLEAYSEGVNAYIKTLNQSNKPIEYKLLNYDPEPWSPYKCALFFKHMANVLCSRERDFEMTNARQILGQEMFDFLYPERNSGSVPVIPSEKVYDFQPLNLPEYEPNPEAIGARSNRPYELFQSGIGSNNWAVSPKKSQTGHALLANDPHLPLRLPSIWYLVHISTPYHNVMGVSFPGIPGVVLGFNDYISWGVTNVGHDVLDWIKIDFDRSNGNYIWDGQTKSVEWKVEEFKVAGGASVFDSVAWTEYGPIWEIESIEGKTDAIMRWVALDAPETDEMNTFIGVNKSQSVAEGLAAIKNLNNPAQNFVFASKEGDIAMRVQGKLPLRKKGYGRTITSAGDANTWHDFIPQDHVPYIVNPKQGYVASANQVSTDSTYPYYYINGDFRPARAKTINLTLQSLDSATAQDMMSLQLNNYDIATHEFMKTLLPFLPEGERKEEIRDWDGRFEAQCEVCILVDKLSHYVQSLTYDELNSDKSLKIEVPNIWRTSDLIKNHPDHVILDKKKTDQKESAKEIISEAYQLALKEYEDEESSVWYEYRDSRISHIIPSLEAFGAFNIPSGGTGFAPNALRKTKGPSWRLVSELSHPIKASGVYPGGQSGHVGSQFYDNMLDLWINGEYVDFEYPSKPEELSRALFRYNFEK